VHNIETEVGHDVENEVVFDVEVDTVGVTFQGTSHNDIATSWEVDVRM
jgi:hypothetical protein